MIAPEPQLLRKYVGLVFYQRAGDSNQGWEVQKRKRYFKAKPTFNISCNTKHGYMTICVYTFPTPPFKKLPMSVFSFAFLAAVESLGSSAAVALFVLFAVTFFFLFLFLFRRISASSENLF